jgi:hypothetical protein
MNIDLPASKPDGGLKDPDKAFAALYDSLRADIERTPHDNQIPPAPLSADDEAEVKEFVEAALGLRVADVPSERIFLGGEILCRSNFREGRIGIWEGLPVFVLLYRMERVLRTVVVWPRDGINVRLLAKAIVWGYAADFPPSIGETDFAHMDRFFRCRKLDFSRLSAAPIAEAERLELLKGNDDLIYSLRADRDRIAGLAAHQEERLQGRIDELLGETESFRDSAVSEANRAEFWRLLTACSVVAVPIAVWLMR